MTKKLKRMMKMGQLNKKIVLTLCIFFVSASLTFADEESEKSGISQKPLSLLEKKAVSKKTNLNELKPRALEIIEQALSNAEPRIRANAIEVIAETRQIKLMPKVEKLLKDESMPVRFNAAMAIGDVQYKLAKKTVSQMLNDTDINLQIAANYAMIRLGSKDKSYEQNIYKALTNVNQTIRANAAAILGKLGNQNDLTKLYWVLKDPASEDMVRFQALESIAKLGDEKVVAKIWPNIISSYNDVRVLGIRALGELGSQNAKEIIITKLDDDVLEVRLAAATQLGRLNDKTGEEEVLKVFKENLTSGLSKPDLERVNFFTTLAIGEIATESLTKYLPSFLENDSKLVQLAAAKAVLQCTTKF